MTPLKFKHVIQIVMADNNNIDCLVTDGLVYKVVRVVSDTRNGFELYEDFALTEFFSVYDPLEYNNHLKDPLRAAVRQSKQSAICEMQAYALDDDTPVTGYGTHSGRKYWQLPVRIQNRVKRLMRVK